MSDEAIIKQINESRANQRLREYLNEGRELNSSVVEDQQALERYNQMSEAEKKSFRSKGWKNG